MTIPTVLLIPGDGVGSEVIPAAAGVLAGLAPELRFREAEAGWACFQRHGTALPEATLAAVRQVPAILFGATQSPSIEVAGYASPILALRRELDLYGNLRPARSLPGEPNAFDLLIVRENSEGLYSGREHAISGGFVAERVITGAASERIAQLACQQALLHAERIGRPARLTVVHKANVLKKTDGLFRTVCLDVITGFPELLVEEMLVDTAAMWLAMNPARFDVLVTTNLFGDILSDLAAGKAGGLGLAPSANIGGHGIALFEPVHGSAPDIAGKGIANPIGALRSGALLLRHLGMEGAALRLEQAIESVLTTGPRPHDLGGKATTRELAEAVLQRAHHSA